MTRASSNMFACFKPFTAGDQPSFNSPVTSDDQSSGRRRMAVNRTFSRAVKAVLFKSSLVKKIKQRKRKHRSSSNSSSPSSKHEKLINNTKKNNSFFNEEMSRTNSNRSSSLFTSTCPSSASSISSNSRSGSKRIKESVSLDDLKQINKRNSYKYTSGMYIIFVCLVAVVFLGKAFAIVACTSTWLFFAPCNGSQSEGVDFSGFDSEDHKKRVIMEGLLQRNNRPRVVVH